MTVATLFRTRTSHAGSRRADAHAQSGKRRGRTRADVTRPPIFFFTRISIANLKREEQDSKWLFGVDLDLVMSDY